MHFLVVSVILGSISDNVTVLLYDIEGGLILFPGLLDAPNKVNILRFILSS